MSREKTITVLEHPKPAGIGSRIRDIRGEQSQMAFGKLLGVSQNAIKNYERGRVPRGELLLAIAGLDPLRRGVEWLLTGESAALYKEGAGGEGRAADPAGIYGEDLDRRDRVILKAVVRLLREADDDIKRHLLRQVQFLMRAAKNSKGGLPDED